MALGHAPQLAKASKSCKRFVTFATSVGPKAPLKCNYFGPNCGRRTRHHRELQVEQYGQILNIAMPLFLALVLFEKWYGWRKGFDTVKAMDSVSRLSSGLTNVVKDVLGLTVTLLAYEWLVSTVALVPLQSSWVMYAVAFVALDFYGYWEHRLNHRVNVLWNRHVIHHSSEEFNLACALRQSVSSFVNLFTIFLLPAALLGVPSEVIAVVAPLHLFAQFWYHTRHIDKMGWL